MVINLSFARSQIPRIIRNKLKLCSTDCAWRDHLEPVDIVPGYFLKFLLLCQKGFLESPGVVIQAANIYEAIGCTGNEEEQVPPLFAESKWRQVATAVYKEPQKAFLWKEWEQGGDTERWTIHSPCSEYWG